jgi:hypothetical protein
MHAVVAAMSSARPLSKRPLFRPVVVLLLLLLHFGL